MTIYHCGANAGFSGLISCMDMSRFFDENEDEMIEWLKQEADMAGCQSTLAY